MVNSSFFSLCKYPDNAWKQQPLTDLIQHHSCIMVILMYACFWENFFNGGIEALLECNCLQLYYIATSRELKRLDSLAMSPIFGHFSESLTGLLTLRAFRQQGFFSRRNHEKLDHSNRVYWLIQNVRSMHAIELFPGSAFLEQV